ncbi:MAG: ABC transporter permease [Fusicatenibacter sp.]
MKIQEGSKPDNFIQKLENKEKFLSVLQIILVLLTIAAFFTPALIAQYNGASYYVRGIDMVMGREVPGDKYGMVPQTTVALGGFIVALGALAWLIRNKDKSSFLVTFCSVISLVLLILPLFENDAKTAKTDPIIDAMVKNRFQYGYYLILVCLAAAIVVGVFRILANRGIRIDLRRHSWIYIMAVPVVVYILIFFYYPMYGNILAFKEYVPRLGIIGSPWVGLKNFVSFFQSNYFSRLLRNTLILSGLSLVCNFIPPILFALFLNEIRSTKFKRVVQTATYMPHFISLVVVCGLLTMFLQREGLVNQLLILLGMNPENARNLLADPKYYRVIYIISGIWQSFGWSSIVYVAAMTGIDSELYEAAAMDGAGRFRKMWSVTLPGIMPTIIIMLIMAIGNLMNLGYEKTILLYNPQTYETADIISSYVYRRGIVENNYGFSTAVNLFNTAINFVLVVSANKISKRVSETRLW